LACKTAILLVKVAVSTSVMGRITRDLRETIIRQLLEVGMAFYARAE
jgi:hypothetical protein